MLALLRQPARILALLALGVFSLVGCGMSGANRAKFANARLTNVAGLWEGFFRETIGDGVAAGDTSVERQAWSLEQRGNQITGFYVTELTMVSGDGRPYLCSREPRFQTLLRFEVVGRIQEGGVELQEVGDVLAQGACRPAFSSPRHFRAEVRGDTLVLQEGGKKTQLRRRSSDELAGLLTFASIRDRWTAEPAFPSFEGPAESPGTAPAEVEGLWVWEHRANLPGGDEKVEREEWHLQQEGAHVSGYYDRTIRQMSTDGHTYRCNNALAFRVVTRYQVHGEVRGNQVNLFERAYEILEGSPCDSGQRRLDSYQGEARAGEIHLMWGVGSQVLKRARPNLPTQRF